MDKIPKFLDKLNRMERMSYEASLKTKWDTQNAFDYAIKEAAKRAAKEATKKTQEEERTKAEQERLESAKSLKQSGVAIHLIAESFKLPLEVVEKL
ncbi:hypothetical protein H8S90_15095 [Olivibacter sp. SDN3]|nr:hypothetical protein H8S90_15095 [Olivibacter sp. SDN3]